MSAEQRPNVLIFAATFVCGALVYAATRGSATDTRTPAPPPAVERSTAQDLAREFRIVAKRLAPAVVSITTERLQRNQSPWSMVFGRPGVEEIKRSFGTGFVVDPAGHVVTNHHVVSGVSQVLVRFHDGQEVRAQVVGTDPLSDLALLQLPQRPIRYPTVEFGDSDSVDVGDWVLAIGSPFGLDHTVTAGIVSAKGRSRVGIAAYEDFIQTDVAINPGNSGGPLVNLAGQVVGVTTAIASENGSYQGIGFAIPTRMTREVIHALREDKRVIRGWLGVALQDVSPSFAYRMGYGRRPGAMVVRVNPETPASRANLAVGDLIVALDDEAISDATHLQNLIAQSKPVRGPEQAESARATKLVELQVVRANQPTPMTVQVTLEEREQPEQRVQDVTTKAEVGVEVSPLSDRLRRRFGWTPDAEGVVIVRVDPGSLAAVNGIRPGMVLQAVNGQPIYSVVDLQKALGGDLASRLSTEGVVLQVWDGALSHFLWLKL
ncbi:MAG: trypsin-like peptidase domain-containing protein [Planctomycetes bacterium]|nr:trypsin-like peptidase domain-containing protein [Planctomycetota bacterium]